MSESAERELEDWRREWQSAGGPPAIPQELRRLVARERRKLIATVVVEAFVVAGAGLGVWFALRSHPDPVTLVWAAAVGVLFAIAVAFAWWNRRGLLDPEGESCGDYLALARARCVRRLRSVRFGYLLLAIEVLFLVVWGCWDFVAKRAAIAMHPWPYLARWALTAVVIAAVLIWARWARHRAEREMAVLARMAEETSG